MGAGEMYSRVPVHFFRVYPVPLPRQKYTHSPNRLPTLNIRFPRLHSMTANHSLFFPLLSSQADWSLFKMCLACNNSSKLMAFLVHPALHFKTLTNVCHLRKKKKLRLHEHKDDVCDKRQLSHFFRTLQLALWTWKISENDQYNKQKPFLFMRNHSGI